MTIDEGVIGEIVTRVLSVTAPQRIILFGSAASGRMTRDSDVDLLVLESSPSNHHEESVRIADALRGLGLAFDVIVMPVGRFDETKGLVGGIAYPAHRYGRAIYEASCSHAR